MEEHKFLNFISRHWSKLLLGFLAIASVAAWGERFFSANKSKSQQDFILANQIYERFRSGETLPAESIEAAEKILERHPELYPKYNMMLAMVYMVQADPKGFHYAKSPFKHVARDLPSFYQLYAETSLLIAEKKYQEAYVAAEDLHTKLIDNEAYSTLRAMNLLRIVSLEMEIGVRSEAWKELKSQPAYTSIAQLFKEGSISLEDWHSLRLNDYK